MSSLSKIASYLNVEFFNDRTISKISKPEDACENSLTWARSDQQLVKVRCGVVICDLESFNKINPKKNVNYLIVNNPRLSFSKVTTEFLSHLLPNYHNEETKIHKKNQEIFIGNNVFIGENVVIGKGTVIHNNVSIFSNTKIGENCTIKVYSSIGTEGLGQEFEVETNSYFKFPQIGGVEIGNGVELGPYSTIRRAAIGTTIIKEGVKIGSFCNIGHNSIIGKNCLLTSNVVIAGSSNVSEGVFFGIGSVIRNKVNIDSNSTIGAGAVVIKDIPKNETWVGNPAKKIS